MSTKIVFNPIGVTEPITPSEPLQVLPNIPSGALVVVEDRAPIGRYGMALHKLHGSPVGAVAGYDPRLNAVAAATHTPTYQEGQTVNISADNLRKDKYKHLRSRYDS